MKEITLPLLLALTTGLCTAQEVGRVISSTPVIQQVSMPRQVCTTQQVKHRVQNPAPVLPWVRLPGAPLATISATEPAA